MDRDILVAGECLVDFIPDRPGPLSEVEGFTRRAGGAPANVAVRLAQLGSVPLLWTRLGDDPFGDALAETLSDHGLPGEFIVRDDGAKTSLAFVSHDETADRAFSFYRHETADTRFQQGTVSDEVLDALGWVAYGGVCLATEPARSAMYDLADRARSRECTIFFDPNGRPELWEGGFPEQFRQACRTADVVKATPEDLAMAGIEGSPADMLDAVLDLGPRTVVLTLGGAGARGKATEAAPWGPATASHDGYDVTVADATGAGDAFTAGVLAALAGDATLGEALAFANGAGAVATTRAGAMSAHVDRSEIERLRHRDE